MGPTDPVFTMRQFICLLGLALLASCRAAEPTLTADPVLAEDSSSGSIHLRSTHAMGSPDPARPSKHVGVEIELHSGEFEDALTVGEDLRLDENLISGPIDMRGDFDLSRSSLFVEWRDAETSTHRFTKYAGLSFTNLDMEIAAGPTRDTLHDLAIGAMLGGRVNTTMVQDVDAYAKLEWHFGKAQSGNVLQALFEAGAAWRFHDSYGLHLGWQLNDYQMERDSDDLSDIDLSFGGPFATLLFSR